MPLQPDFTSLAVHDELVNECVPKNQEENLIFVSKQSAVLVQAHVKSEAEPLSKDSAEEYATVNFIPDEVRAYIAACESSIWTKASQANSSDPMDLDSTALVPVSSSIFEPARCLNEFTPPKRFYRTFWRSVSRRILALSNMQAM